MEDWQDPEEYLEEADRLLEEGAYAEALEACRKALALDPGSADARALTGRCLAYLNRVDEAEKELAGGAGRRPRLRRRVVRPGVRLVAAGRRPRGPRLPAAGPATGARRRGRPRPTGRHLRQPGPVPGGRRPVRRDSRPLRRLGRDRLPVGHGPLQAGPVRRGHRRLAAGRRVGRGFPGTPPGHGPGLRGARRPGEGLRGTQGRTGPVSRLARGPPGAGRVRGPARPASSAPSTCTSTS